LSASVQLLESAYLNLRTGDWLRETSVSTYLSTENVTEFNACSVNYIFWVIMV